jgi:hypothetical protein
VTSNAFRLKPAPKPPFSGKRRRESERATVGGESDKETNTFGSEKAKEDKQEREIREIKVPWSENDKQEKPTKER